MASHEFDPGQDESLRAIIAASGSLYRFDYATAQGWRTQLTLAGALIAEKTTEGGTVYVKAEKFPEPEPATAWVDQTNARLKQEAAQATARLKFEHGLAEAAEHVKNAPIVASEAREWNRRIDLWMQENAASIDARIEAAVDARLQALGLTGQEAEHAAL